LRHQLRVLARSDPRFRPSDRLLWLCLRHLWPRWREALVLPQPATVARWHREGFRGCWSRRSRRRAERPHIDSQLRALIRRMADENRLWGAPRIHGELCAAVDSARLRRQLQAQQVSSVLRVVSSSLCLHRREPKLPIVRRVPRPALRRMLI
jgi:hypothetical protein